MRKAKRERLEKRGWRLGTVEDFLGLSPAEAAYVELRLRLSETLRSRRKSRRLSQTQVARLLSSSQDGGRGSERLPRPAHPVASRLGRFASGSWPSHQRTRTAEGELEPVPPLRSRVLARRPLGGVERGTHQRSALAGARRHPNAAAQAQSRGVAGHAPFLDEPARGQGPAVANRLEARGGPIPGLGEAAAAVTWFSPRVCAARAGRLGEPGGIPGAVESTRVND
jgi:hypothetical protein